MIERINNLLQENNKKQADLSKFLNIPTGNLSNILKENGRKFSTEQVALLAAFFNVSTDYLYGLEANVQQKLIPLIGKSSCGKPQDYDLNGYDPIPVPLDMYRVGMYAVEADGESMSPKINHGDIVYCQPNQIIDNGKIVHYSLDGESGIKKYKINEAGTIISLLPINSDFDIITIHCDEKHDLKMAKVVGKIDTDF
jgi:repressor LexA